MSTTSTTLGEREHLPGPVAPALAIIADCQTPYRLHLHQRIAREIPGLKLISIFTHAPTRNAPWQLNPPPEIGAVLLHSATKRPRSRLLRMMADWAQGRRIIRYLRDHSVPAVIVNGYSDPARVRVIRWCRRNGVPCFLWGDSNILGDTATGVKRMIKNRFVRSIVRACTGVLPCGRLGRAYFERYGASPERVFPVPLGPDYDLIRSLSASAIEAARQRFALDPARRRIVYSGRLVGLKRIDLLIDAFASIADQRPEWDLVIVGDGELRDELKSRVPSRLQQRVIWTGFMEDQSQISAIYRASDVLALCSEYEPWALVVLEGAAAGLALVCSDQVGAAAEVLRDGINGRIFTSGDVRSLTECLLDVTAKEHIDSMKAASAEVLDDWRRQNDPVQGIRKALHFCGVLPGSGSQPDDRRMHEGEAARA